MIFEQITFEDISFNLPSPKKQQQILPYLETEESESPVRHCVRREFLPEDDGDTVHTIELSSSHDAKIDECLQDEISAPINTQQVIDQRTQNCLEEQEIQTFKISEDEKIQLQENNSYHNNFENQETVETLKIEEITDIDEKWTSITDENFMALIESPKAKLFDDIASFQEICGCQDYLFIDKADFDEIYREFQSHIQRYPRTYSKRRLFTLSETFHNPRTQSCLKNYKHKVTNGIVCLVDPSDQTMNLVVIKINFISKTIAGIFLDTPGRNVNSSKETLRKFVKYIKRSIRKKTPIKFKFSKFTSIAVFLKPGSEPIIRKSFRNCYFPYYQLVKTEWLPSIQTLGLQFLRDSFTKYLDAAYHSGFGIASLKHLITTYHEMYVSSQRLFFFEELQDFDSCYQKIEQFLAMCLVGSVEFHSYEKLQSVTFLARICKSQGWVDESAVVLHFENKYSAVDTEELFLTEEKFKMSQIILVFCESVSHLAKFRTRAEIFFSHHQDVLDSMKLGLFILDKAHPLNLFSQDKAVLSGCCSILLNEGLSMQDVMAVSRLCPEVQYNFLCTALNKIPSSGRSSCLIQPILPQKALPHINVPHIKISEPNISVIKEVQSAVETLGLDTADILRKCVDHLNSLSDLKKIVLYAEPSEISVPGSFIVDLKDSRIPKEPFTLVIVNKNINSLNNNICNIIEPDGTVYMVFISSSESNQPDGVLMRAIESSIVHIQAALPGLKSSTPRRRIHFITFKEFVWDSIEPCIDLIVGSYLKQYKSSHNTQHFVINSHSVLSLLFCDGTFGRSSINSTFHLLMQLKKNSLTLFEPDIMVTRSCRTYDDEVLNTQLAIFFTAKNFHQFVFCVRNDLEFTFHVVVKSRVSKGLVKVAVASLIDQSFGENCRNFYQKCFAGLQRDLCNVELTSELIYFELEPISFLIEGADAELMMLCVADAANDIGIVDAEEYKRYFACWWFPSILGEQINGISQRLRLY